MQICHVSVAVVQGPAWVGRRLECEGAGRDFASNPRERASGSTCGGAQTNTLSGRMKVQLAGLMVEKERV